MARIFEPIVSLCIMRELIPIQIKRLVIIQLEEGSCEKIPIVGLPVLPIVPSNSPRAFFT
jgi:hypothetical protein